MCLHAPHISGGLKHIVLSLFEKVRDSARHRHFDGYQIDPGKVLRCDGSTPKSFSDHDLSAIFVCFPYLAWGRREPQLSQDPSGYPARSIQKSLYPYETTSTRDALPSFRKGSQHLSGHHLHVPQVWIVIIGSSEST